MAQNIERAKKIYDLIVADITTANAFFDRARYGHNARFKLDTLTRLCQVNTLEAILDAQRLVRDGVISDLAASDLSWLESLLEAAQAELKNLNL